MTGIDVAPIGTKRYYKYFKHLAKAAKKTQLREQAKAKLKEQLEKTKETALGEGKKGKVKKAFQLLEKSILNLLEQEKKILSKENESAVLIRDLKNDIKELKERQNDLATERAFRFDALNMLITDMGSKFGIVVEREKRIKKLEYKIKGKVSVKSKKSLMQEQVEKLEKIYKSLKGKYSPAQLKKIKERINNLKKKLI